MRKTNYRETENKITVTLPELQNMLNCGRYSAEKIAVDAGAKIKIGRRTLYHVGKIESHLAKLADQQKE